MWIGETFRRNILDRNHIITRGTSCYSLKARGEKHDGRREKKMRENPPGCHLTNAPHKFQILGRVVKQFLITGRLRRRAASRHDQQKCLLFDGCSTDFHFTVGRLSCSSSLYPFLRYSSIGTPSNSSKRSNTDQQSREWSGFNPNRSS